MMVETYTAQEMREVVRSYESRGKGGIVTAMLRQAADTLEREEKRKKKYEYAERFIVDGMYAVYLHHNDSLAHAKDLQCKGTTLVRREVGEWEEVK